MRAGGLCNRATKVVPSRQILHRISAYLRRGRLLCRTGKSQLELIALVQGQFDFFLERADACADRLLDILTIVTVFQ